MAWVQSGSKIVPPVSPAPFGYVPNPYAAETEAWLLTFDALLDPKEEHHWKVCSTTDDIVIHQRSDDSAVGAAPYTRGSLYFTGFSVAEVVAAIHIAGYRQLWDTRLKETHVLQRYGHYEILGYVVLRGIGFIFAPRDICGVHKGLFYEDGVPMAMCSDNTDRADMVQFSRPVPSVPLQDGKVRASGRQGYRIDKEGDGVRVTYLYTVSLSAPQAPQAPSYISSVLLHEIPRCVGRLRDALSSFGWPPYTLDLEECLTIQFQAFDSETRELELRAHATKNGSFIVRFDRKTMYPEGATVSSVSGEGSHNVHYQVLHDHVVCEVTPRRRIEEFVIRLAPEDPEQLPEAPSDWW